MEDNSTIKIITKEKKEIELTKKAAQLSELLKNAIIDYQNDASFPINELEEKTAEKIKEYLTHFNGVAPKEIEKPLQENEMKNVTDEWSANFIDKLSVEELVNLTVASNFMGINCLLDLCAAKIASMCKDKSEDDILKSFGITEPFTDEDKKKIKEENKWIDENL